MTSPTSDRGRRVGAAAGRPGGERASRVGGTDPPALLVGKLGVPEAAVPVLRRPRLFAMLDRAAERRVTVLSAPAGAGKTMLLASWLRETPERPAAWLSLDDRDNRQEVFWGHVLEALRHGCPGMTAAHLAEVAVSDPFDRAFPHRFVEAMARIEAPVVLVLDDMHMLHDPTLLAGLYSVLRNAPDTLRLVLSGRGQPGLPLARLRVAGDLVDLDFHDLAGTKAEVTALFGLLGLDLSPVDTEVIVERTEGWMSGLRLAALWSAAQPHGRRDIRTFAGDERVVADYLSDEILTGKPPAVQRFLLRTCLVDPVNGELADSLTGGHDGARRLDELDRENALVESVGPHRTWFRYRPLLREFLRAELNRRLPEEVPLLRQRAARWYARKQLTVDALRNAIEAEDWDFAARLLAADDRVVEGQGSDVEPLLARIPEEQVVASPELAAVFARLRLSHQDPQGAEPYLRIAEPLPEVDVHGDPTHELSASDDLAHRLRYAELRLLQAGLRGRVEQGELEATGKLLDRATEAAVLPRLHVRLGALAYRYGLAQMFAGATVAARVWVERALPYLDAPDQADRWRRALAWYALLTATEGRLAAADAALAELSTSRALLAPPHDPARARDHRVRWTDPGATQCRLAEALVCLQRDQLDEAWQLLDPPPEAADGPPGGAAGEPPLAPGVALARGLILIARGAYGAARSELTVGTQVGVDRRSHLRHRTDLAEAEILLGTGDLEGARAVLTEAIAYCPTRDLAMNTVPVGRLCLAEGDAAAALDAVTPCLRGSTADTRLVDTIGAHLVAAAAHRRLGRAAIAADHLETALALSEPDRAVRVFLTAGRTIRSLLTVVIPPSGPYANLRALLLHHFETRSTPRRLSLGLVQLTSSEAAVLRYLPSHLTNEEIAEDLCLSVNTVKSHLRSLYRKLEVASRREAIARARQLGLLSP